jgi:hypothetical protein
MPDDAVWAAHAEAQGDLLAEVQRLARVAMRPDLPLIAFARRMAEARRTTMLMLPPCSRSGSKTVLQAAHRPRRGTLENQLFSTFPSDEMLY